VNKRNRIIVIVLIVIIGAVVYIRQLQSDFNEATEVVDQFYSSVILNDTYAVESLFHPAFLEVTSIDEVSDLVNTLNSKLGPMTSYENVNMNMKTYSGTDGSYTRVELVYEVKRTRYDSVETIVLRKEGSYYLIYGYNIDSKRLIQ